MAREFGFNASRVHARVKAAGGPYGSGASSIGAPLSMNERHAVIKLRRKFKQLQQARELLEMATGWFAGNGEEASMSSTNP